MSRALSASIAPQQQLLSIIKQSDIITLAQNAATIIAATAILGMYEALLGGNTIPVMTSNILPSGIASSNSSDGGPAWPAFDVSTTTMCRLDIQPSWLQYQFTTPTAISSYSIDSRVRQDLVATAWNLQGSPDGTTWTTIDTRTAITVWSLINTYYLASPVTYMYYRISFTASLSSNVDIYGFTLNGPPTWGLLLPGTDYSVRKYTTLGSQALTITKLKAGTNNHVVDYV